MRGGGGAMETKDERRGRHDGDKGGEEGR